MDIFEAKTSKAGKKSLLTGKMNEAGRTNPRMGSSTMYTYLMPIDLAQSAELPIDPIKRVFIYAEN